MSITLLLQAALMISSLPVHDLKLSVCEIVYQADQSRFELSFYIFQDDLKASIYQNPEAPQLPAEDVKNYVQQHFDWQVNAKKQALHFVSVREKNDQVAVLFRSGNIPLSEISSLTVNSTVLTAKFREQVNMVYAILPGQGRKVQMLTSAKTQGQFNFNP